MYHGAYLIVNSKKITIYTSGKYIFVGLKNVSDIEKQFKSMKKLLKPFLEIECIQPPITQNIVITDRISESINFLEIVEKKSKFKIEYEPERFPGMIFRNLQGTCLIFRNGKILITGVKSLNDAQLIKNDILEMIK
jgi:transcription initiation factor TFIID TATA-box-binding protein